MAAQLILAAYRYASTPMHSPRRVLIEALALGIVGVAAIAWAEVGADSTERYTALAAVFTLIALIAAYIAARTSWPQYQRWRDEQLAEPELRLWLQSAPDEHTVADDVAGGRIRIKGSVIVRVAIGNESDAVLRSATINIVVPTTCVIEPIDPPAKEHYLSPLPSMSSEIVPGTPMPVRFTVARAEITKGHHVFHAKITPTLGKGPWPVMVELTGDPTPAESVRYARLQLIGPESEARTA